MGNLDVQRLNYMVDKLRYNGIIDLEIEGREINEIFYFSKNFFWMVVMVW